MEREATVHAMFRAAMPRNLVLPWIAAQVAVALPLIALAEAWGVTRFGLFVDPARVSDWGEVLGGGPLWWTRWTPSFSGTLPALLFWLQLLIAWTYAVLWLDDDCRKTNAPRFWMLPSRLLFLAPFCLVLALFTGPLFVAFIGLLTCLAIPLLVFCLHLQVVFALLYAGRRLRNGERFVRFAALPLTATSVAFTFGLLALFLAPSSPQSRVSTLLRRFDADVRNRAGDTMLHHAVRTGDYDLIKTLLARGASPHTGDPRRETPLFRVAETRDLRGFDYHGMSTLVRMLKSGGADLNARNARRDTPLHRAVERGDPDFALALLERGADPNLADVDGRTPLHLAVRSGNGPIARRLLKHGADPDRRDARGDTPARYARRSRDAEIHKALGLPPSPAADGFPLSVTPAPSPGGGVVLTETAGTSPTPRR